MACRLYSIRDVIRLSGLMRCDLHWWLEHAAVHNSLVSLSPHLASFVVYTDACLSPVPSVGIFCAGAFVSLAGPELVALGLPSPPLDADINHWECFAVLVAVHLFGVWWQRSRVVFFCDNAATIAWVSGGSPRPPGVRGLVQQLFGLCLQHHIRLAVQHIPGEQNVLADALSRRQWARFGPACADVLEVVSPFLSAVVPALQGW